jgi:hypothetical protein
MKDEQRDKIKEIKELIVETMKKEAKRNGNTPHDHGYSKVCSCGICHNALILSDTILEWVHKNYGRNYEQPEA